MKTRVLIIDDAPDLNGLMTAAFQRAGFDTYSAQDGYFGAKLFYRCRPHLVVTDIVMPDKEGIETIMELRRDPDPPKIIAISGGGRMGGQDFLCWAKQLGADEILLKPFQMSALVALARRVLGEGRASHHEPHRASL